MLRMQRVELAGAVDVSPVNFDVALYWLDDGTLVAQIANWPYEAECQSFDLGILEWRQDWDADANFRAATRVALRRYHKALRRQLH